jgi:hypothetical protein
MPKIVLRGLVILTPTVQCVHCTVHVFNIQCKNKNNLIRFIVEVPQWFFLQKASVLPDTTVFDKIRNYDYPVFSVMPNPVSDPCALVWYS